MNLRIPIVCLCLLAAFLGLFFDTANAGDNAIQLTQKKISEQHRPKVGYWEGDPFVSFRVTDDGNITDFKMSFSQGSIRCSIEIGKFEVGKDGSFGTKSFVPEKNYRLSGFMAKDKDKIYMPEIVTIEKEKMVEVQRINGKFDSAVTVTGSFRYLVCEDQQFFWFKDSEEVKGRKWSAKWVRPQ
ncbi:MAG: hypothetical protein ABIF87_14205 [Pseudomonadota bacterium]